MEGVTDRFVRLLLLRLSASLDSFEGCKDGSLNVISTKVQESSFERIVSDTRLLPLYDDRVLGCSLGIHRGYDCQGVLLVQNLLIDAGRTAYDTC